MTDDPDREHGDVATQLFIALQNLEDERARNDSLAAINCEVETENDKLRALLVDLYNADPNALHDRAEFATRMRECGIEVDE